MKFFIVSLKTVPDYENCSESRIKFLFRLSFALIGQFFPCTFMAGFRNNFQDHRRVMEQLLETQAVFRKSEQSL
jgi:hypothetical protein